MSAAPTTASSLQSGFGFNQFASAPNANASVPVSTGFGFMGASSSATPAPAATGFGFLASNNSGSNNNVGGAAAAGVQPSGTGGLGGLDFAGLAFAASPTPAPAASSFGGLGMSATNPGVGGGFGTMSLDDALNGMDAGGAGGASNAALRPLGSAAAAPAPAAAASAGSQYDASTDFSKLSAGQIKKYLESKRVSYSGCVEKAEFVALAVKTARASTSSSSLSSTAGLGAPIPAIPILPPVMASASATGTAGGTSTPSAIEVGMNSLNAFEVTGFASIASAETLKSNEHDRLYRAASGGNRVTDLNTFMAAARSLPIAQLAVPAIPSGGKKLGVRLPSAVLDPVIREVPLGYMREHAITELNTLPPTSAPAAPAPAAAAGTSAAPAPTVPAAAAPLSQRTLMPYLGHTPVGPRRCFEVPLRADAASNADVIGAMKRAGAALGLDAIVTTSRSIVLMQRVSVPSSSFSAFEKSQSVTGVAPQGGAQQHARTPIIINKTSGGDGGGSAGSGAGGGIGSWLGMRGSTTTYVNCICVYTGINNASGERIAMLVSSRFQQDAAKVQQLMTDAAAAAKAGGAAAAAASASKDPVAAVYGRLVSKDRVGGSAAGAPSSSSAGKKAGDDVLGMLSQLTSAGSGIVCSLVNKRSSGRTRSYRDGAAPLPSARERARTRGQSSAAAGTGDADGAAGSTGTAQNNNSNNNDDDPFGLLPSSSAAASSKAANSSSIDAEDAGVPSTSATVPTNAAITPEETYIMSIPALHPSITKAISKVGDGGQGVTTPATDAVVSATGSSSNGGGSDDGAEAYIQAASGNVLPDFDDGSDATDGGDESNPNASVTAVDWSHLRVSFLDPDVRTPAAAPSSAPDALMAHLSDTLKSAATAASASGSTSSFSLSDVEDELVSLTCAFAASMRSEGVLAECAWTDAIQQAKTNLAAARGEAPLPSASQLLPSGASALSAPKFMLHADTVAALSSGHKSRGEARLFKVANLYEARARIDELLMSSITTALAPACSAAGVKPPSPATLVPHLSTMPIPEPVLEEVDEDDADAAARVYSAADPLLVASVDGSTSGGASTGGAGLASSSSSTSSLFPAPGPNLTATDTALRAVYARAYIITRRLAYAAAAVSMARAREVDLDMRTRLLRKKAHVALRCGAAFHHVLSLLSQLSLPSPAAALSIAGGAVDPGRTLVSTTFGISDEQPLVYAPATSYKLLGEIGITAHRLLFHANVLGFRTKVNIPIDAMVAVHRSRTGIMGIDNTVTITYVDDEKVAAKAKAAAAAAEQKAKGGAAAAAAAPSSSPGKAGTDVDDLFAGLGIGTTSTAAATAAIALAASAQPTSIDDAFGAMCEIDGAAPAAPSMGAAAGVQSPGTTSEGRTATSLLDRLSGAPAAAAATAKPAAPTGQASTSTGADAQPQQQQQLVMLPGLSEPLTPADMLSLIQCGGTHDTLAQIHITPTGGMGRDGIIAVLQTLRQAANHPYLHYFDFELGSTATAATAVAAPASQQAGASAATGPSPLVLPKASLPKVVPVDYHTWVQLPKQRSLLPAAAGAPLAPSAAQEVAADRPLLLRIPLGTAKQSQKKTTGKMVGLGSNDVISSSNSAGGSGNSAAATAVAPAAGAPAAAAASSGGWWGRKAAAPAPAAPKPSSVLDDLFAPVPAPAPVPVPAVEAAQGSAPATSEAATAPAVDHEVDALTAELHAYEGHANASTAADQMLLVSGYDDLAMMGGADEL